MDKGEINQAIRRAMRIFEDWNDIVGFVPRSTSYYYEIESIIEDAVHCGVQQALKVYERLDGEPKLELPN